MFIFYKAKLWFTAFFLFIVSMCYAQDVNFNGRVTDGEGVPIGGATVELVGVPGSGVTSASDGSFSIPVPASGDAQLDITYGGQTYRYDLSKDAAEVGVGTVLVGAKPPAPGLTDFDGDSKYVADLSGEQTKVVVIGGGGAAIPTAPPSTQAEQPTREVIDESIFAVPGTDELEEVVVIGYGTVKKSDATGATGVLKDDDFNKGINTSPETLLQGKMSGIQVTSSSGEPGSGMNVRIRGTSSVRAGNNPLFVVDGFPIDGSDISSGGGGDIPNDGGELLGASSARNPLNFINPADIERIDILKDASATAIYGARGANGVVLITTKKGRAGRSTVTYTGTVSVSEVSKKLELLKPKEFLDRGYAAVLQKAPGTRRGKFDTANDFGSSIDWQDEIFRIAISHSHDVSFSGGNANGDFRFSLGYLDQQGIIRNTGLEKWTANFKGSNTFFDGRVELGVNGTYALLNNQYAPISNNIGFEGDLIGAALQANPTRPVFERNRVGSSAAGISPSLGGLYFQDGNVFRNPVAMLNYVVENETTTKFLGNVYAKVKIVDWLEYKVSVGLDKSSSVRRSHFDYYLDIAGVARQYNSTLAKATLNASQVKPSAKGGVGSLVKRELESRLIENTLRFNKEFGDVNVTFLAGFSYQSFSNIFSGTVGRNFSTNDNLFYNVLGTADDSQSDLKAYGATASNKFSELQSYFGRADVSILDKYLVTATLRADGSSKFGDNNKYGLFPSFALAWKLSEEDFIPDFFDDFKLRVGYGIAGNQEFPGGISQAALRYSTSGAIQYVSTPNPNIKWESTATINVGIDFAILNNRLSGALEFFDKSTTDLITQVPTPAPAVTEYYWDNLAATVKNTGFEVLLNAVAVDTEDFSLSLTLNATFVQNKVENLGDIAYNTGDINGQGLSGAFSQRIVNNRPLNVFYMKQFTGFNARGFAQYAQDGSLQYVGSPNPDLYYGFSATAVYKGFDLTFVFNGVSGNKVYNNTANALFYPANLTTGKNITTAAANSGQSPQDISEVSTLFLEDGSFLRLQNLVVGYTRRFPDSRYIKSARISFTAQNLFVLTSYSGYDPEVNTNKARSNVPSFGIDYYSYPRARTFTLSVSCQF